MKDGLQRLDPKDLTVVAEVARLHIELLPGSPISRLGPEFTRQFYYRKLVEDGLVCCSIYYCDGVAAGFIAYTTHSNTFMMEGLRRHWLYISAVIAGAVIRQPRRLRGILWTLKFMRKQRTAPQQTVNAELLSFGVLLPFRTSKYIRETGQRISLALYDHACEYFRAHGVVKFRAVVEKSNREALLFYHALECEFDQGEAETVQVLCTIDS
jgi:ribosomal protein S18 acetylase RimI-like enzyme